MLLGGIFALLAAATFAWTNAAARRGVVSGSPGQAVMLSIPIGLPIFLIALAVAHYPGFFPPLPTTSLVVFAFVGISHFCMGRYCNYRSIKAIGTNLAGPVMQFNLVVSLALAIFFLGEKLTVLRIAGILLIFIGPALVTRGAIGRGNETPADAPPQHKFSPRMAEGYAFAVGAALCYGCSPPLVRYAVHGEGLTGSLAGGVVAAGAATVVAAVAFMLPGLRREVRNVAPQTAKWFVLSGVIVYVSQIFAYMAVALAPVTITAPIIGLNNVFRLHLSRWINPHHEVFGPEVMIATVVSFVGVIVLSLSVESLPWPASWQPILSWSWP